MEDVEHKIYNLIKQVGSDTIFPDIFWNSCYNYGNYLEKKINDMNEKPPIFILINTYERDLLINNGIQIKGILYNNKSGRDADKYIKKYEQLKYDGEIYLLGFIPEYDMENIPSNIHVEVDFNSLKYLSNYSHECYLREGFNYNNINNDDKKNANKIFVETLLKNYKSSLFYSQYNTGIVGIEGYLPFHKEFYKYIETIDNIYLINCKYYQHTEFLEWLSKSEYKNKIKHLDLYVCELFITNPELIAYYRVKTNNFMIRYNYIQKYFIPYNSFNIIDEQIIVGNDTYRHIKYYKNDTKYKPWFPEDEITHIINVSDEIVKPCEIPNQNIIYEHYPINESETDENINRTNILKISQRIYELVNNKKNKIYVHCSLGVNRSPLVILMYYIKYCGMSLYEAYKFVASKRRIFTSINLFKVIYEEALLNENNNTISPLKLRTHYAYNFSESTAYMFALYDVIYLDNIFDSIKN